MNPYLTTTACVARLYREYQSHKKLIVAVDFDDSVFDYHKKGHSYEETWAVLQECQKLGFYIVCFTGTPTDKWDFIREYFNNNGIKLDSINKNPIPLPFGNDGKIYFNVLLDDRAGLGQTIEVLWDLFKKINQNVGGH